MKSYIKGMTMKCRDHNNTMQWSQGHDNIQSSLPSFRALHLFSTQLSIIKTNGEWAMSYFVFCFVYNHAYIIIMTPKLVLWWCWGQLQKKNVKVTTNYTTIVNYHRNLTPNVIVLFTNIEGCVENFSIGFSRYFLILFKLFLHFSLHMHVAPSCIFFLNDYD